MDPPAPTRPVAPDASGERPAPTDRRLAAASISLNTRRTYSGALRRLDAWLGGRRLEDAALAGYLAELPRAGESAGERLAGGRRGVLPGPPRRRGEPGRTARVLAGYRRTAVARGRGQAPPVRGGGPGRCPRHLPAAAASRAAASSPRRSPSRRGRLDAVIAGLLFMARMRRSEMSALRWADVATAAAGDGMLVTEAEMKDVRFVKDDVPRALQTLRAAASPAPDDRVVLLSPQMVVLRFQAAARAAGVEHVTGRVGLASELTRRGASTTDVMLAGNWKTSRRPPGDPRPRQSDSTFDADAMPARQHLPHVTRSRS